MSLWDRIVDGVSELGDAAMEITDQLINGEFDTDLWNDTVGDVVTDYYDNAADTLNGVVDSVSNSEIVDNLAYISDQIENQEFDTSSFCSEIADTTSGYCDNIQDAIDTAKDKLGDVETAAANGELGGFCEVLYDMKYMLTTDFDKDSWHESVHDVLFGYVKDAADTLGGNKIKDWLRAHKNIAMFLNSCRAAGFATTKRFGEFTPVAVASAAVDKFFDTGEYTDMTISDIADSIKKNSSAYDKTWSELYTMRVEKLDSDLELDKPNRRLFITDEDEGSSTDDSAELA
jgi:hypothetical protein